MKSLKILIAAALLSSTAALDTIAQRAVTQTQTPEASAAAESPRATAPQTFKANYQGGVFGYNRKQQGTLTFDDESRRLIFRDKKNNKEVFSISYDAITATFADSRSRTSTGGQVISNIPTPYGIGQVGRLFRTKSRYLTLQYRDADTEVAGMTSFKIDDRQLLESVVPSVAAKAGLIRRGEIYVRRRDAATGAAANTRTY